MDIVNPDIYLFNPTCEYAVANGNASWQPNRILRKMESDMAVLPLFFASGKDYVVTPEMPSAYYIEHIESIGIVPPVFITPAELCSVIPLHIGKLCPWGWSPAVHKFFEPLKENCSLRFKESPVFNWDKDFREVCSKKFARNILTDLVFNHQSELFISDGFLPEICTSREGYEKLLKKWGQIMVKAPWSSSGRGLQPVRKAPVHPKVWEKLLGIIKTQGYAIVEPYLDKVADMALQFSINKGGVAFEGISNFVTDYKGQYAGNCLNGFLGSLDLETAGFVKGIPEKILPSLIDVLQKSELGKYYEGYFGVDILIFKDSNGNLKVNPCLEINVRYNMGLLSVILEKYIHQNKKGTFKTFFKPGVLFKDFCDEMLKKYPLTVLDNKIASGFFPVTDIEKDSQFGAYLLV